MRISICDDNKWELHIIFQLTEKYMQQNEPPKNEPPKDEPQDTERGHTELMKFQSASELLAHEEAHGCSDVYILDILMPDMDGIALGHILREKNPRSSILYLTNAKEYAIEAFSVRAFSYLLKPVTEASLYSELDALFQTLAPSQQQMKIRSRDGVRLVMLDDIIAIEYFNHRLIYHTTTECIEGLQQRESFDRSVSDFMESGCFLKISASHIVNMRHVKSARGSNLYMDNDTVYKIIQRFSNAKLKYMDFLLDK